MFQSLLCARRNKCALRIVRTSGNVHYLEYAIETQITHAHARRHRFGQEI